MVAGKVNISNNSGKNKIQSELLILESNTISIVPDGVNDADNYKDNHQSAFGWWWCGGGGVDFTLYYKSQI